MQYICPKLKKTFVRITTHKKNICTNPQVASISSKIIYSTAAALSITSCYGRSFVKKITQLYFTKNKTLLSSFAIITVDRKGGIENEICKNVYIRYTYTSSICPIRFWVRADTDLCQGSQGESQQAWTNAIISQTYNK